MNRNILLIPALLCALALAGFRPALVPTATGITVGSSKPTTFHPGIYGSCGCGSSGPDASKMELILNDDYTFRYFDSTNPEKVIEVNGFWSLKGTSIVLDSKAAAEAGLPLKWKITGKGNCIKTKKGMSFYRICNTAAC